MSRIKTKLTAALLAVLAIGGSEQAGKLPHRADKFDIRVGNKPSGVAKAKRKARKGKK